MITQVKQKGKRLDENTGETISKKGCVA